MTDRELMQMALDALEQYPIRTWGAEAKKHLQARLAQPEREWVGLTDEEVENFVQAVWPREAVPADYVRAIEAKLKEKNT